MVALTRRALRNEVRTLEAQLDQARADAARHASANNRLRLIAEDNQTTIAALQQAVRDLRHLHGRKDLDLTSFVSNAHRAELAELQAQQAREDLAEAQEQLRLARVRIEELGRTWGAA